MNSTEIRTAVDQLTSEIAQMSHQTQALKNGKRFKSEQKLRELRSLLVAIEEIDQSLDALLAQQQQKRKSDH